MEWLIPSIAIDLGFKIAVCLILFVGYFETNEKFVFYWSLGWAAFAGSVFFELFIAEAAFVNLFTPFTASLFFFLKHVFQVLMGIFFLKSILVMRNIHSNIEVIAAALVGFVSSFLGTYVISGWLWAVFPTFVISGFSLIICALYFRHLRQKDHVLANNLMFWGFLLNGVNSLAYPFMMSRAAFASWNFSIPAFLSVVFAAGLLIKCQYHVKTQRKSALESAKELSALDTISSMVCKNFKLENFLKEILTKASEILNLDAAVFHLLDEEEKIFKPIVYLNMPLILADDFSNPIKPGENWIGEVVKSGEMKILNEAAVTFEDRLQLKRSKMKTLIVVPVKNKGKTAAVMQFVSRFSKMLNQDELHLLSAMSNEAAVKIEHTKLCNSVKKAADNFSILHNICMAVTNYVDMDRMLNDVLQRVIAALETEAGVIYVAKHKDNNLVVRAHFGLSEEFVEAVRVIGYNSDTLTAEVMRAKKAVCVEDMSIYPNSKQKEILKEGLYGYCGVPIVSARERVVGVLIVCSRKIRKFIDDEVKLLTTVAHEIGAAVESAKLYEDLQDVYLRSVTALAEVVDAKDHYTYSHSKYVTTYAVKIAREMRLQEKKIEDIRKACQLHDIGKISISDYILNKKKKLTAEDWKEIRKHPDKAAAILEPLTFLKEPGGGVIELIKQHHERCDGEGYPLGLKSNKIKLGAKIIAVADAYHAMVSDRPYRRAFSQKKAVREIRRCSGTQFDPKVVEAFLTVLKKEKIYVEPVPV